MAKFPGLTITALGQKMIIQSQGSGNLIFTRIALGDGELQSSDSIKALTDLKSFKLSQQISIIDTTTSTQQVSLTAIITNAGVETGFFARELGVYAKIGENGTEQLYGYSNAGNYADYVPDKDTPIDETHVKVTLAVADSATVSIDVNSQLYVTEDMLAAHNTSLTAHQDIRNLITNTLKLSTTANKPASMDDNGMWVEIVN